MSDAQPTLSLFKVAATFQLVVRASSLREAEVLAKGVLRNEPDFDYEPSTLVTKPLTSVDDLEGDWEPDCIPWGVHDPLQRSIETLLHPDTPPDEVERLTPEQAVTAIRARIAGEWNNPQLKKLGTLSEDTDEDIKRILAMTAE